MRHADFQDGGCAVFPFCGRDEGATGIGPVEGWAQLEGPLLFESFDGDLETVEPRPTLQGLAGVQQDGSWNAGRHGSIVAGAAAFGAAWTCILLNSGWSATSHR